MTVDVSLALSWSQCYINTLMKHFKPFNIIQAHCVANAPACAKFSLQRKRFSSNTVSFPRPACRELHQSGKPIHDWQGDHREMLFSSIPNDIRIDSFHRNQSHLLDEVLEDYWKSLDSASNKSFEGESHETTNISDPDRVRPDHLFLGRHLVYFNIPIRPDNLMPDGTDKRFLPGPASFWPSRLWAGGSIKLHVPNPPRLSDESCRMIESVLSVRVVGKDEPEKAFVTITKRFSTISAKQDRVLVGANAQGRSEIDTAFRDVDGLSQETDLFTEEYTLCFVRGKLNISPRASTIRPPSDPEYRQTITPTRDLLFCWSALTYNAHRIHIDPHFARQQYGIKDVLVHGPLTVMLMLEYLRRLLIRKGHGHNTTEAVLRSISYRNLAPLYVDEPFTICAKPTDPSREKWSVWIQTGEPNDKNPRLAVKAVVIVDNTVSRTKHNYVAST